MNMQFTRKITKISNFLYKKMSFDPSQILNGKSTSCLQEKSWYFFQLDLLNTLIYKFERTKLPVGYDQSLQVHSLINIMWVELYTSDIPYFYDQLFWLWKTINQNIYLQNNYLLCWEFFSYNMTHENQSRQIHKNKNYTVNCLYYQWFTDCHDIWIITKRNINWMLWLHQLLT